MKAEDTETTCNISKSIKEDDEETGNNIGLGSNSNDAPLLCYWYLAFELFCCECGRNISTLWIWAVCNISTCRQQDNYSALPSPPPISFLWFIIAKTFFKNVCLYQESFCRSKEVRVSKILTIGSLEQSQKNVLCESLYKIDLMKMLEIQFLLYQEVRFQ